MYYTIRKKKVKNKLFSSSKPIITKMKHRSFRTSSRIFILLIANPYTNLYNEKKKGYFKTVYRNIDNQPIVGFTRDTFV